jgi:hypothetical protein
LRARGRAQFRAGPRARGEWQRQPCRWRKEYSHLRDGVIAAAPGGSWTVADFTKIQAALAVLSARRFGNKKAWSRLTWRIGRTDVGFIGRGTLISGPKPIPHRSAYRSNL